MPYMHTNFKSAVANRRIDIILLHLTDSDSQINNRSRLTQPSYIYVHKRQGQQYNHALYAVNGLELLYTIKHNTLLVYISSTPESGQCDCVVCNF